ncbi:unnamed protein product [Blepharisma stoltei]|uniref:MSP domain-containing protein n=1 Tax=Blepharisma stoltei TaxID=1481888 RepID=A0AAU9IMX5_9CILI|nr:unnamed protein product [Blepharisma stoltei]
MSDSGPLVLIDPSEEIRFEFIANTTTTGFLRIKNITNENLAFKVKTTVKEGFFVRPNQGVLKIGEEKELSVTIRHENKQPAKKQKLLVEAAFTSLLPTSDSQQKELIEFWKETKPLYSKKLNIDFSSQSSDKQPLSKPTLLVSAEEDATDDIDNFEASKEGNEPGKLKNDTLKYVVIGVVASIITGYFAFLR